MSTPPRTDVHRPSALVTEDYDFAYSYDAHPDEGSRSEAMHLLNLLLAEGFRFGQVHGGDTCDHCGQRLRYVAVLKHLPTRTLIKVGEQCLGNRFELATAEFHRLRKAAELNRQRRAIKNRRLAWFAVDPDREVAFAFASERVEDRDYGYEGMRHSFVSKINRDGETTDKFVRAIMRDMARTERYAEERAAKQAEVKEPVVVGDGVEVVGEVVGVKWHENDFGGKLAITVKDDRGFRVWGTAPRALIASDEQKLRGSRVSFVANLTASPDDETFGFFKRPRRAQFVNA